MTAAAAIAAQTSRVRIGANLIQLPLHNPVRLAEEALVVDAISGGRLRLGVGMGYTAPEYAGLGLTIRQRVSRMEEGIAILRHAFAGEPFAFEGRRHSFSEIHVTPGPMRPGGPEIWIGGFADPAIQRAARLADGFMAIANPWESSTFQTYFDACAEIGKPEQQQRLNATYWAIIAEDPEKAFAEAGEHWMHLLNQYILRGAYSDRDLPLTEPFTDPKEALDQGLLMLADGPTAIDVFNNDIAQGVIDFSMVAMMPGEPADQVAERLQYLNDKVVPFVHDCRHPAAG